MNVNKKEVQLFCTSLATLFGYISRTQKQDIRILFLVEEYRIHVVNLGITDFFEGIIKWRTIRFTRVFFIPTVPFYKVPHKL